ncbi:MAG: Hpt domain-containing protein, partial [Cyanobacteria bacterium J06642_9]
MTMIEDEELQTLYRTAGTTNLQTIDAGLNQLAQQPDDQAVLETLRKAAHSLKGDSRVMGLDAIAALSEQIEARIKQIQRAEITLTNELAGLIKQGLQVIDQLIDAAVTGTPAELDSALMLNHLSEGIPQTANHDHSDLIIPVSNPVANPALTDDLLTGVASASDPLTGETLANGQVTDISNSYLVETPLAEAPLVQESNGSLEIQPLADEAFTKESLTDAPLAETLFTEEPLTEGLLVEESLTEEPLTEEPLIQGLVTEAIFT